MKRILLLTIALTLCLALTGCVIIPLHQNFEIDEVVVSSIQIYDLNEYSKDGGGFLDTLEPVYEIPVEQNADFLQDLSEIRFSDTIIIVPAAIDPSFYYGRWTVRINYIVGAYQLISSGGYGELYGPDGELTDTHHYGCDDEEWLALIKKYLPESFFDT